MAPGRFFRPSGAGGDGRQLLGGHSKSSELSQRHLTVAHSMRVKSATESFMSSIYIGRSARNNTYCLRGKRHELTLATRRDSWNFYQRLLFKDTY